ncbi:MULTISPECIES: TnpV protein [Coprococcus]|uniref:TnpV protein n=1 Tax=Coprococcus aceti TaxID=2981786 RepID=A0ABV1I9C0_9FIRM|nr:MULTISPECIES: TnpV protein [Coprococcus]MEE0076365.1 TnpV protein [Coprococcus sp.]
MQKAGEAIFSRLVKQFSEKEGVTEALKAENQMLWVQRMNNRRRLFLFRQYSISHKVP